MNWFPKNGKYYMYGKVLLTFISKSGLFTAPMFVSLGGDFAAKKCTVKLSPSFLVKLLSFTRNKM